jgi:hypothetical protein
MEDRRTDEDDDPGFDLLSGMVIVYTAMLGATILGQGLGIALDSLLGIGTIGVPIGCSVALDSLAGARIGAAKSGGSLTPRQAARIAFTYSGGLLVVSLLILAWMDVARTAAGRPSAWTPGRLALALGVFAVAAVARCGLMVALAPRSRP